MNQGEPPVGVTPEHPIRNSESAPPATIWWDWRTPVGRTDGAACSVPVGCRLTASRMSQADQRLTLQVKRHHVFCPLPIDDCDGFSHVEMLDDPVKDQSFMLGHFAIRMCKCRKF